jgi:carboxypeptidase Taq
MKDFLGVDVPDDAHGVLQDVQWSQGYVGYFPTYALGNVISLQIWQRVRDAIPDLDDRIAGGDLGTLAEWLREHVYALGAKFTPKETLERVTGTPELDPEPYLAYLRDKQAALVP